jgi:hypothetical protein
MRQDALTEFLCSLRLARQEIRLCRERIEELENAAARITAAWKEAPGGRGDVHKDATVIALADKRSELLEQERAYAEQMLAVESFISRLEDPVYRAILELRYVKLLRWPQVVEELKKRDVWYTDRHVARLHGQALAAARRLWNADMKGEKQ